MVADAVWIGAVPFADLDRNASLHHKATVVTGAGRAAFFPFHIPLARSQCHPGQHLLKARIQGSVIHGAAHLCRDAPAVRDIVPDAGGIVVVIEPIGHGIQILLGLFSP
jgi:hypothetical protein